MNQYIMCKMQGSVYSILLHEGKAVEIHCDSETEETLLGNIYVGRIRDIAANIGAAFVEIAPGTVCYLALSDLVNPIYVKKGSSKKPQMGDELLVQVSREAMKTKYPSVTTNLTLYGKYILLTTGVTQINASSKLEKTQRQKLIRIVEELEVELLEDDNKLPVMFADKYRKTEDMNSSSGRSFGWLIRTNASGSDRQNLRRDMSRLLKSLQMLLSEGTHRVCYSCVVRREHAWIRRLSDLYEHTADVFLTDDESIWLEAKEYLSIYQPEDLPRLSFQKDEMQPLYKKYSLKRQLEEAIAEKVWLNSGGYLIIQPTEALTVIDVNTGKYEGGGKNRQKAFLKINREAAKEAARQIRLRNLSGMILIDFINMDAASDNEELLAYLDCLLRLDPVRTVLVDMTKLSLVEITRTKKEKPLVEQLPDIAISGLKYY